MKIFPVILILILLITGPAGAQDRPSEYDLRDINGKSYIGPAGPGPQAFRSAQEKIIRSGYSLNYNLNLQDSSGYRGHVLGLQFGVRF